MIPQTRIPVVVLMALDAFAHAMRYAVVVPRWQVPDELADVNCVMHVGFLTSLAGLFMQPGTSRTR